MELLTQKALLFFYISKLKALYEKDFMKQFQSKLILSTLSKELVGSGVEIENIPIPLEVFKEEYSLEYLKESIHQILKTPNICIDPSLIESIGLLITGEDV